MFKALASHGRICGKWFVKGPKANLAAYHKKRHLAHHVMHPHVAHPACAGFLMLVHLSVQTQITAVGHRTPLPINVYANKPRKLDLAHYCLCQQNMCDDIPLLFVFPLRSSAFRPVPSSLGEQILLCPRGVTARHPRLWQDDTLSVPGFE